jgi:hypothetical protein
MKRMKQALIEISIFSLTVFLSCVFLGNLAQGNPIGPYEDTVYFEPAPGSRISADGDTFYVDPEGEDIKINVSLKNETPIMAFTFPLLDRCYDGSAFLGSLKNNHSTHPICYQGSRVENWGARVINLDLYPPQFILGGVAMTAPSLLPGDGIMATLTFTTSGSGTLCLDTIFFPAGPVFSLVDEYAVGYTPRFVKGTFHVVTCPYVPGDLNWDEFADLLDLPLLIYYLFRGWEAPCPLKAADVNCDQEVGLVDVVYLINYIFRSGPAPQICEY